MAGIFKTIDPNDQTVTPFKVYKSWEYTGTSTTAYSGLISQSISISVAIKPNPANFTDGIMPIDFDEECDLDFATRYLNYTNKYIPAGIIWKALKHQYFNNYTGHSAAAGAYPTVNAVGDLNKWRGVTFKQQTSASLKTYELIENELNPSSSCELGSVATVISIPQAKFGEEIKPGSLEITLTSPNQTITDDGNGNLVSSQYTPVPKIQNRLIYLGFNECEYETNLANVVKPDPRYPTEIDFYNVVPSSSFISAASRPAGIAAAFSQSYIRIDGTPSYFNPNVLDDYAVSFWFNIKSLTPGHGINSHLISKRSLFRNYQLIDPSGRSVPGNIWRPNANIMPYDIFVTPAGVLTAQAGDGTSLVSLTTAGGAISTNTMYHCVFQKTGSKYELYVNNAAPITSTKDLTNIVNQADIFIGCKGIDVRNNNVPHAYMHGEIDEVQIFNTALTTAEISKLYTVSTLNNSYNVGKIFYKKGLIVITGLHPNNGSNFSMPDNLLFPRVLYDNVSNTNLTTAGSDITIRWNSTLTLYENEVLCRIRENEYNFTMNPSILKKMENSQLPQDYVYNDEFTPYITTVGLYNENAELLAIGKLANPIKKRSNVDLNILVRFDQ